MEKKFRNHFSLFFSFHSVAVELSIWWYVMSRASFVTPFAWWTVIQSFFSCAEQLAVVSDWRNHRKVMFVYILIMGYSILSKSNPIGKINVCCAEKFPKLFSSYPLQSRQPLVEFRSLSINSEVFHTIRTEIHSSIFAPSYALLEW